MTKTVMYVGLDVHKNTIAVAVAEDGKRGEIANTPAGLTKLLGARRLRGRAPRLL